MGSSSGECIACVWVGKESAPDMEHAIAGTDAHPTALPSPEPASLVHSGNQNICFQEVTEDGQEPVSHSP